MSKFIPFKPCNIETKDLDKLPYIVIVQPKLDGIRCVMLEGKALTYSLKPIPNLYIRRKLEDYWKTRPPVYMSEGEIMLTKHGATFQEIQSAVMTRGGAPDFRFWLYDHLTKREDATRLEYHARRMEMMRVLDVDEHFKENQFIQVLANNYAHDVNELHYYNNLYTFICKHEGTVIRSFGKHFYKFGRATARENTFFKLKAIDDAEAKVIGVEPLWVNNNEPEINNHGRMERGHSIRGKHMLPMLGSIRVVGINGPYEGKEFNIGSGFTNEQRDLWWQMKPMGKIVKYKYQSVGGKDLPRQPIFLGFRDRKDM